MNEININVEDDLEISVYVERNGLRECIYSEISPDYITGLQDAGGEEILTASLHNGDVHGYKVGDKAFGGIVYGYGTGVLGTYLLIASDFEEGDSTQVGCGNMAHMMNWSIRAVGDGFTAFSLTDGLYNTYQILSSKEYSISESVFQWLNLYVQGLNSYNDWYIPSKVELDLLYINRFRLDNYLPKWYCSSTEATPSQIHSQRFRDGIQFARTKAHNSNCVRAVRRQPIL